MVSACSSSGISSPAMSVVATGSAPPTEYVARRTKPGSSVTCWSSALPVSRSNTTVVLSAGAAGATGSSAAGAGAGAGVGAGEGGGVPPSSPSSPPPSGPPPPSGSSSGLPRHTTLNRRSAYFGTSRLSIANPSSVRLFKLRYARSNAKARASSVP